eukprot:3907611-Rhodomonas_salina.1
MQNVSSFPRRCGMDTATVGRGAHRYPGTPVSQPGTVIRRQSLLSVTSSNWGFATQAPVPVGDRDPGTGTRGPGRLQPNYSES